MVSSRTVTAVVGLLVSLLVSVVAYVYFDTLFLFLFVPFVPLLLGGRGSDEPQSVRTCPACGFRTADPTFEYCPRDGTRLDPEDRGVAGDRAR
ncbi:MAG: hypothetical protein ABEJ06_06840 [Haloarculaceae archaeon]